MKPNKKFYPKDPVTNIIVTASYKVSKKEQLLEFLLRKVNQSRNNVKRLLSNHQVLVNGVVTTQFDTMLNNEDEVQISKYRVEIKIKPELDLPIIYEDDDFIAINKPSGLLSVASDKEKEQTAYSKVTQYMRAIDKKSRIYVIHRIDRDTSGVLVFAKDERLQDILRKKWNDYVKVREYFAICEGTFTKKFGRIQNFLMETDTNIVYSTKNPKGQLAITNYEVVKESKYYSLVKVLIETGRKNQIRVHMKDLGHNVVGDEKYGSTKNPINRLGLHASELQFLHPLSKKLMVFRAPVPGSFKNI